jgi:hypothetical protein
MTFFNELLSAWRTLDMVASPRAAGAEPDRDRLDGAITFGCPACGRGRLAGGPGLMGCADCSWVGEGEPWEIAKLARAIYTPPECGTLPTLTLKQILSYTPDPEEDIWQGAILQAGMPATIVGAPGIGKSRLSLQAALMTICGLPFLGFRTQAPSKKWLFLQTENSVRRLKYDLSRMTEGMTEKDKQRIEEQLRILDVGAMDFATICMGDGARERESILATLEAFRPGVVVIDPLRDAGRGDPNSDADMTATCQGIARTIRAGDPKRAVLAVHHGRTGAAEASKVFGDDASSFGRNSKVLHGWVRSQINIAAAGAEHPGIVIVGCGKCSDGPRWAPFAARLDEQTMLYERLSPEEFDLEQWAQGMGGAAPKAKAGPKVTMAQVAELLEANGGVYPSRKMGDPGSLEARLMEQYELSLAKAKQVAERACRLKVVRLEKEHGNKYAMQFVLQPAAVWDAEAKQGV